MPRGVLSVIRSHDAADHVSGDTDMPGHEERKTEPEDTTRSTEGWGAIHRRMQEVRAAVVVQAAQRVDDLAAERASLAGRIQHFAIEFRSRAPTATEGSEVEAYELLDTLHCEVEALEVAVVSLNGRISL